MKSLLLSIGLLIGLVLSTNAGAAEYRFEMHMGTSYHAPQDLTIKQDGQPDIEFKADFETNPLKSPQYYNIRLGVWDDRGLRGWEVEHIHDKMYVEDGLPSEVQLFEVTDGYNLFFVNRAWRLKQIYGVDGLQFRLGLGPVVAHPEITVRGKTNFKRGGGAFPCCSGYQLAGVAGQVGVQKIFDITDSIYASVEGKAILAQASVDIADGSVDIPNHSVHGLFGLGVRF